MSETNEIYDVAVIGGGPAGIMAAINATQAGAKVAIIEKNRSLGRKLLITGNGRCNITQNQPDANEFVKKIGKKGKFLFSSLSIFGTAETIDFFESLDLPLKTEKDGKVFPVSDRSGDVLGVLKNYLEEKGVKIFYDCDIQKFDLNDERIVNLKLKNKNIQARNFILATGGKSYPATGSTGDGYRFAKKMGHTIVESTAALVPVKIKENWVKSLQGLSLKNVAIKIIQKNKKEDSLHGEMLFTHFGLSGPMILDASKRIGELLKNGEVMIDLDLYPALDYENLDEKLKRDFANFCKKNFENYLPEIVSRKMADVLVKLSGIDGRKKINYVTKEERKSLVRLMKGIRMSVAGLMGFDQAIITSGGVDLREVESKTMRSKIIGNLFFAGEILDLDGSTGGYNLQICWSTGHAAGKWAAAG